MPIPWTRLFRLASGSTPVLLAVVVAMIAMLLFGRIPNDQRWAWVLGNAAHAPALAIITIALIALVRTLQPPHSSLWRDYAVAVAIALLLGGLVEVTQLRTGRDASWGDLGRNALGSLAAAGFMIVSDSRVREVSFSASIRRVGLLIGVLCTLVVITPVLITGAAYFQRTSTFPVLVDFSSPLSTYFIGTYDAITVERERLPERDAVGLHARILSRGSWALVLWETYPDWRDYQHLALELANTSPRPLVMQIRIRDRDQHTIRKAGHIGSIEVAPGSQEIHRVQLQDITFAGDAAALDPTQIRAIILSAHAANGASEFYLTRIWLE